MNSRRAMEILIGRWRLLLAVAVGGAIVGYGASFLIKPSYRATTQVVVVQRDGANAFAGLSSVAGAFGLNVGQGRHSLDFFAAYILSRDLLRDVVNVEWAIDDSTRVSLAGRWGRGDGEYERTLSAIDRLVGSMKVSTNTVAGTLTLSVDTFDPVLSALVANHLVGRLNAFDVEVNRWFMTHRTSGLESRMAEVEGELSAAEEALTAFRDRNLVITHPRLQMEEMRLLREVKIQAEVLQAIRVQAEMARLEKKADEPVIKVLATAEPPLARVWPRRGRIALLLGFACLVLCGYGLVAVDTYRQAVA